MKTRDEVEALKRNWKSDPCWDLEQTEGFEEYVQELRAHRIQKERQWRHETAERAQRLAIQWGVPNQTFGAQMEVLLKRVAKLEAEVEELRTRVHETEVSGR